MVLRFRKREIAAAFSLLVVLYFVLRSSLEYARRSSSWRFGSHRDAHVVGGYPYVKPTPLSWATPFPTLTTANWNATHTAPPSSPVEPNIQRDERDRILVVASLAHEDVSWLSRSFPSWQTAVYPIMSSFSLLHQSRSIVDKGRIANAYLTYLIENYYNLPSTIVFLTPHRNTATRPKTQDQTYISLGKYPLLKTLNLAHVQKTGYLNLRCQTKSTCLTTVLQIRTPLNEYDALQVAIPKAWVALFPNTTMPERLSAPCCAEFAVSREQIRKRDVQEYMRFWEWLNKVRMDDDTAGLVLEALWHVVFGKEAVDCEEDVGVRECECDVYGRC